MIEGELANVTDYGAVGDGVTDDSAAVLAAIAASPGGVYFPAGSFNCVGMTPATGRVFLVGDSGAEIIGFSYYDPSPTPIGYGFSSTIDDSYFSAVGINFTGYDATDVPGLTIRTGPADPPTSISKAFMLDRCVFRGKYGLRTQQCIEAVVTNCLFPDNVYGWDSQSCTNINVSNCQWYGTRGIALFIQGYPGDIRLGGENFNLTNCTFIDGVTAIFCYLHNAMWLTNVLVDYFNLCLYMEGARGTRLVNSYFGQDGGDRSTVPGYVAPTERAAIFGVGNPATGRSTGVTAIGAEVTAYGATATTPIVLTGLGLTRNIEEVIFQGCRFFAEASTTSQYIAAISQATNFYFYNNIWYSPNNDNLVAPWIVSNPGVYAFQNNDYSYCYDSSLNPILPAAGYVGAQFYEAGTVTLTCNGTDTTDSGTYSFKNEYSKQLPIVVCTPKSNVTGITSSKIAVGIDALDFNDVFIKASSTDGATLTNGETITVSVVVIGV
jgi:hypothetical protein